MSKIAEKPKTTAEIRKQAKKHISRIRELGKKQGWPKPHVTQEQAISELRKVREKLWE